MFAAQRKAAARPEHDDIESELQPSLFAPMH